MADMSEDFEPIQLIADSLGPGLSCGCEKSYRCLRDGCIPCCYCGVGTPEATPIEGAQ